MKDFLYEILYCFLYGPIYIFGFLQGCLVQFIEDLPNIPKAIAYGFRKGIEAKRNGIPTKEALAKAKQDILDGCLEKEN